MWTQFLFVAFFWTHSNPWCTWSCPLISPTQDICKLCSPSRIVGLLGFFVRSSPETKVCSTWLPSPCRTHQYYIDNFSRLSVMLLPATKQPIVYFPDFDYPNFSLANLKITFTSSVTLPAANAAWLGSALNLTCLSQMIQQDRWQHQPIVAFIESMTTLSSGTFSVTSVSIALLSWSSSTSYIVSVEMVLPLLLVLSEVADSGALARHSFYLHFTII